MNKEQQEILNEVYENYYENINLPPTRTLPLGTKVIPTLYTQEEFINKCKTDSEFSERWGLKIEERKLNLEERVEILRKKEDSVWLNTGLVLSVIEPMLEEYNIPTKLITITYNDKTIESYE